MTVLADQHIERRRAGRSRTPENRVPGNRAQRRQIRRARKEARRGIPAVLLILAAGALVGAILLVVPRLEEYSRSVIDPDAVEEASAEGLLGFFAFPRDPAIEDHPGTAGEDVAGTAVSQDDLVAFEITDDVEYIVGEGETLSEIAVAHDVDYELLARFNNITNPHSIRVGTRIIIPGTLTRGLGLSDDSL